MRGENYFIYIIPKNGKGKPDSLFRVPMTIKKLDELTIQYANKSEFLRSIVGVSCHPEDVDLEIRFYPSLKKRGDDDYRTTKGPLYKKDIGVFNVPTILNKFELLCHDRNFVKEFVKRYKGDNGVRNYAFEVTDAINNGEDYSESLRALTSKIFRKNKDGELNYKSVRNLYLAIRKYEYEKEHRETDRISRNGQYKIDMSETIMQNKSTAIASIEDVSDEEFKEMRLQYLNEHERENLDIEDFDSYREISPFDNQRIR